MVELCIKASANFFAPASPILLTAQHRKRMIFVVPLEKVVLFEMQKEEGNDEGSTRHKDAASPG